MPPPITYRALRVKDKLQVKAIKTTLERLKQLDSDYKITFNNGEFLIPILGDLPPELESYQVVTLESTVKKDTTAAADFKSILKDVLATFRLRPIELDQLLDQAPTRYLIYPPLLLLSPEAFSGSAVWTQFLNTESVEPFFQALLSRLSSAPQIVLTHVAENAPIPDKTDILRLPSKICPLYPLQKEAFDDSNGGFWCTATQNGIKQTWAPMHTMFSRGNIKEKARILGIAKDYYKKTQIQTTAVDLYAGIGYFTFSYAASGGFKSVLCWELNPWSTEGLVKGSALNKWITVTDGLKKDVIAMPGDGKTSDPTIVVFNEDNTHAFERISQVCGAQAPNISHINMGLLPHAHLAFPVAIEISLFSGLPEVYLHVHENVAVADLDKWIDETTKQLQLLSNTTITFLHLEKIKTYAPGVWHICGDFIVHK